MVLTISKVAFNYCLTDAKGQSPIALEDIVHFW